VRGIWPLAAMSGEISALRQHSISKVQSREKFLAPHNHDSHPRTVTTPQQHNMDALKQLGSALTNHKNESIFTCGGTLHVPNSFIFYSDKEGKAHQIPFPASEDDLKALGETCDPATFGLHAEDKLDLDYRSAWKMDNTKFASSFHPSDASDILNVVQSILLPEGSMYAELYKLNVPSNEIYANH
jgi:hypothetical protein